jgi:cobalamin biosynthesis Mg chelatase CobN
MRAGVGPRDPAPRAAVARRLDLTVATVRRAERRGLRALRRASQDGCGAGGDTTSTAPFEGSGAATVLASGTGAAGADGAASSGRGGPDAGNGGSGGSDGKGGGSGGVKGTSATLPQPAPDDEIPILAVLAVVLAAGAGWFAFTRLRERYYDTY